MAWAKGKQLQGGKYVIERVLGRGGFGITYLAKTSNGQLYAIKTVNETVESSRDFEKCQRDFFNEVQRLEKCRHQYIVRIEEVIQDGPLSCMVMEYLPGENLKDKVENGGVLSEAEALRYIRQIGEALIEVHNKGLLHRDVKHENIMLRDNELEAVLIDFGVAREFTPDVTQSHTEKLSDGFAPIEQYFRKGKRGECTDVYGLAATLYFLLTGKRPIPALDRDAEIRDGRKDPLVPPKQLNRQISDRVNQAILQGMALKATDRPQSMREWRKLVSLTWEPGDKLHNGKYTIKKILGNEHSLRTYLAWDNNENWVVIKTLNEIAQRRHEFTKLQQYFLKKARRIETCKHPHMVIVHEVFKEGLLWCMVMEYIHGRSLASYVANQGALPELEAWLYIKEIGKALIALHNNRLLHLDVKPANIILRTGGYEAVLIGFCIAPEFTPDGTRSDDRTLTESGVVTDRYAAPEQYFESHPIGTYTDVYGLAATLHFMLTGEAPRPALDRVDDGRPALRPISNWVNQAILQGMLSEVKDRPQSIGEWLKLLEEPQVRITSGNQPKVRIRSKSLRWGLLSVVGISYIVIILSLYSSPSFRIAGIITTLTLYLCFLIGLFKILSNWIYPIINSNWGTICICYYLLASGLLSITISDILIDWFFSLSRAAVVTAILASSLVLCSILELILSGMLDMILYGSLALANLLIWIFFN